MSGMVKIPFASMIVSACQVVGPFAPSQRIFACTWFAIFSVIWFSMAAGMAMSQDWKRSEEHTSELQSRLHLVCRLLLEKKKKTKQRRYTDRIRLHDRFATQR